MGAYLGTRTNEGTAVTSSESGHQSLTVGFACVAENRVDWAQKVHKLVISVRSFGGQAAAAPIVVYVVEGINDRFRRLLEPLDVTVRQVDCFDDRFPHTNKLRMFEDADPFANCDV